MKNNSPAQNKDQMNAKGDFARIPSLIHRCQESATSRQSPTVRGDHASIPRAKPETGKPVLYNVSINSKETPMQKFQASYEDMAKSAALAIKAGWDAEDGGMLDYIDSHPQTYRDFATQAEAEAWLKQEIAADKTLFGCGDIDVLKQPKRRCRYCVCGGWLTVQSFIVEDTGIVEEREMPDECAD